MRDGSVQSLKSNIAAQPAFERRRQRRDSRTAKTIYQAQVLQRAFGRPACAIFLALARVPPALAARVLRAPQDQLRR